MAALCDSGNDIQSWIYGFKNVLRSEKLHDSPTPKCSPIYVRFLLPQVDSEQMLEKLKPLPGASEFKRKSIVKFPGGRVGKAEGGGGGGLIGVVKFTARASRFGPLL